MAAVIICSDFGAPKYKVSHCVHCERNVLQYEKAKRYDTEPLAVIQSTIFSSPLAFAQAVPSSGPVHPFLLSLLTSDSPGWVRTLCWKQALKCWDLGWTVVTAVSCVGQACSGGSIDTY